MSVSSKLTSSRLKKLLFSAEKLALKWLWKVKDVKACLTFYWVSGDRTQGINDPVRFQSRVASTVMFASARARAAENRLEKQSHDDAKRVHTCRACFCFPGDRAMCGDCASAR
jgi:hypothetical protein